MAAGSAEGLKKLLAAEDFPPRRKPGSGEEELLPAERLSDFPPRRKPGSEELLPAAAAEEGEGGLPAAVDDPFPTLPPRFLSPSGSVWHLPPSQQLPRTHCNANRNVTPTVNSSAYVLKTIS